MCAAFSSSLTVFPRACLMHFPQSRCILLVATSTSRSRVLLYRSLPLPSHPLPDLFLPLPPQLPCHAPLTASTPLPSTTSSPPSSKPAPCPSRSMASSRSSWALFQGPSPPEAQLPSRSWSPSPAGTPWGRLRRGAAVGGVRQRGQEPRGGARGAGGTAGMRRSSDSGPENAFRSQEVQNA
jgi:hypothetical protein